MSFLLFMDESGHDHRQMPYEVRGGISLHACRVWPFALEMRRLELAIFGVHLHDFDTEIKGEKLLDKDRFKWAEQRDPNTNDPYNFVPEIRRQLAQDFLERGKENKERQKRGEDPIPPGRLRMTAYGQSCLQFAEGTLRLLREQEAKLFAVAIPCGADKAPAGHNPEHLRRDLVYLFERYAYFLEAESESGLLVMDQIEKTNDRKFGQRIARYFAGNEIGRQRAERIVPVPLFVSSDMSYAIQAADLCIYALNWGFRLPSRGMNAATRPEIANRFGPGLRAIQWYGQVSRQEQKFESFGIVFVESPFGSVGV